MNHVFNLDEKTNKQKKKTPAFFMDKEDTL